jgi:hypothetical protein
MKGFYCGQNIIYFKYQLWNNVNPFLKKDVHLMGHLFCTLNVFCIAVFFKIGDCEDHYHMLGLIQWCLVM